MKSVKKNMGKMTKIDKKMTKIGGEKNKFWKLYRPFRYIKISKKNFKFCHLSA